MYKRSLYYGTEWYKLTQPPTIEGPLVRWVDGVLVEHGKPEIRAVRPENSEKKRYIYISEKKNVFFVFVFYCLPPAHTETAVDSSC